MRIIAMTVRIAITDLVSNSYFPVLAAEELGFYRAEGLDASVELVMPLSQAYNQLRTGKLAFVGDAAHDPLTTREGWQGLRILMALQQGTPWLLVLRPGLAKARADLTALKGLRIAAALGPDYAFRQALTDAGLDAARDGITLCTIPGAEAAGVSYGVTAARALEACQIDGFWANAMGAAVAVHRGAGTIHLDVRRGDPPAAAKNYSFGALMTTATMIEHDPTTVAAVVRAIVATQRALREDPARAAEVGRRRFPVEEASLIVDLVQRDQVFYDPVVTDQSIAALIDFSRHMGLLDRSVVHDQLVAAQFSHLLR
jgi:ABC-type nitrate/sulfonate/bicarbonate transport system substrate-binding protein